MARLGVRLAYAPSEGHSVHSIFESSFFVGVKPNQHLHPVLMELKDSVWSKLNDSFSLGEDDVLRYQNRLCVPNVDNLRNQIHEESHGSRYSIHPVSKI